MNWRGLLLTMVVSLEAAADATLEFATFDSSNRIIPCRVHLHDEAGKPVKAPGLPFWHDHFVCAGKVSLALAPGKYLYEIERGPEYYSISNAVNLEKDATISVTNRLRRLADLSSEGWWGGENHVHRKPEEIQLLMAAEDLHFAHVITWWNESTLWKDGKLPADVIIRFDGNRFFHVMGGEDERGGGALLYFGLSRPLNITGSKREWPSSVKFLKQAQAEPAAWIEIEKPFWWDVPIWLAHGRIDSIGIAHNHHHRRGMLDNEAWGKARDTARYAGKHGDGLWTQDIYFHVLNCGFRIPPTAGSASGVLPNPVGYNRVYVQIDGEPSFEKWQAGLRAGRAFVSNGPLLRCLANGRLPGHVFQSNKGFDVEFQAQLDSREPIRSIELIHNGRVQPLKLPGSARITESGWFLVRAIAEVDYTFRFACTAPWYVEIGNKPQTVDTNSARFFLDWTRERLARLEAMDFSGKAEALEPVREAETFWKGKN